MEIVNNYIYTIDTFFIYFILWFFSFLILFLQYNNFYFNSKLTSSNSKNKTSPGNPEIDPDDPDNDILKKIKKHLNKYKVEYIIGGSILSFFFFCYYYNINLEDITNYLFGNDPSSSGSDEEGSEISDDSLNFENMDIDEALNLIDEQIAEELIPIDFLDISKTEDNELVRLRPDLDETSETQSNQSFVTDDSENMSLDEALDLLDNEIAEDNEIARLRAALEEASMERIRREADESMNSMRDITMKHITDQLWGKDKGPFI